MLESGLKLVVFFGDSSDWSRRINGLVFRLVTSARAIS